MSIDAEAVALVEALGGSANLLEIDACTTRLRLRVGNQDLVDEAALKALGAAGILRPTADAVQVVMGLRADEIAGNIRNAVGNTNSTSAASSDAVSSADSPQQVDPAVAPQLLAALGGVKNILKLEAFNTRLSLQLNDPSLTNQDDLIAAGFRGMANLGDGKIQVLAAGDISGLAAAINKDLKLF
jgi:PTS system N-acetylglucosamine-specific IIC component